jgi:hypothetical protein
MSFTVTSNDHCDKHIVAYAMSSSRNFEFSKNYNVLVNRWMSVFFSTHCSFKFLPLFIWCRFWHIMGMCQMRSLPFAERGIQQLSKTLLVSAGTSIRKFPNFAWGGGDNKASSLGPHYIHWLQIRFNRAHLYTVVNRGCLPSKLVNVVTTTLKAA